MIFPSGWDTASIPPIPKRMKKRNLVAVISGVLSLGLVLTVVSSIVFFKLNAALASNAIYHNSQNYRSQLMDGDNRAVTTIRQGSIVKKSS